MPKILINDIALYYETYGEGEPLVFISGFSADHLAWQQTAKIFADRYQVVVFDNRGSGRSDVPQGPYTVEQMADDVAALCEKLGIEQAHFIGNSMGGFIAQMLAHRHAARIKSLILCNTALRVETVFYFYAAAQVELMKAQAPASALIKAACSWIFSFAFLSKPNQWDALIQWGLENPYPFTTMGCEGQYAALGAFDARTWMNTVEKPTLVISADQDIIFNSSISKALADQIPDAQFYCFNECGHLPHIEYPETFAQVVMNFLEKTP
jgi:3-oxoadipate enol-lactonase